MPHPPEFPTSPPPVKRFQPVHRPFTKQAAITPTEKPRIHCDRSRHPPYRNTPYRRKTDTSVQNLFPVAATGRQTIRNSPLPLPISRTRKPAKTGTRRTGPLTGPDSSETLPACPGPFPSAGLPVIMDTAPGQPLFFRDYANRPVSPIQTPCRHRPDRIRTPAPSRRSERAKPLRHDRYGKKRSPFGHTKAGFRNTGFTGRRRDPAPFPT